jgi:magnesium chelatase family protein
LVQFFFVSDTFQWCYPHGCPCGFFGYETDQHHCTCTAAQIDRYQAKLSGPILDRIDLQIEVPFLGYDEVVHARQRADDPFTTEKIRRRVEQALAFQDQRTSSRRPNGRLTPEEVKAQCRLTTGAEQFLRDIYTHLQLSMRSYHKLLKVARTIADLNGNERIDEEDIAEAVSYRIKM